jgi:RluA family pseudouridine synthase
VAKPPYIELGEGRQAERIPILYEDRSVLALDKPRGWMLVPFNWQRTSRNLQAAIQSSIGSGAFWARSRHLHFLRYVHRLDADTTGVILFGRSPGAVRSLADMFEARQVEKRYLAVVEGTPSQETWTCRLRIEADPTEPGRMRADARRGKESETAFRLLGSQGGRSLVEARPFTGRTHQIRLHLAAEGHPVVGDDLYGRDTGAPLALRAVELQYADPFTRRPVRIRAPEDVFVRGFGFGVIPEKGRAEPKE